jgi:acetyl-CoA carboxylase biotin carboxyl carrier protein
MAEKKEKDLKKVKELIALMIKNDLVELEIVDGDNKIKLKRPGAGQPVVTQVPMAPIAAVPQAAPVEEAKADETVAILSPIVGTFYAAPSPDSDPFVKVGSRVDEDTVVCIIEAMKVMNEIKSQVSGTIVEIICKGGQAVEFDEPLFKVKPD